MKTREEEMTEMVLAFRKKCIGAPSADNPMTYEDAYVQGWEDADKHPKNPWKNVMTDEPKKDQDVFAHVPNLCGGEYCKLTYLGNYRWSQDEGEWTAEFCDNKVMWMPIPQLFHDEMLINGLNEMNEHFKKGE